MFSLQVIGVAVQVLGMEDSTFVYCYCTFL